MSRARGGTFYFEKEVEVEISAEDLEDAGYHHEDDCPARAHACPPGQVDLSDALASLHRQAHPSAPGNIFLCREEPCRSLGLNLIGYGGRDRMLGRSATAVRTAMS